MSRIRLDQSANGIQYCVNCVNSTSKTSSGALPSAELTSSEALPSAALATHASSSLGPTAPPSGFATHAGSSSTPGISPSRSASAIHLQTTKQNATDTGVVVGAALGGVAGLLILLLAVFFLVRGSRRPAAARDTKLGPEVETDQTCKQRYAHTICP